LDLDELLEFVQTIERVFEYNYGSQAMDVCFLVVGKLNKKEG